MDSLENKQVESPTCFTKNKSIIHYIITVCIDIILPLGIYYGFQCFLDSVYALIIAGVPPLLLVIYKVIRSRTFDALGFITCIGFIISAIIGFTIKDPITVLLAQSFTNVVISSIFGITLIPFDHCCSRLTIRPLIFYSYQDLAPLTREKLGLPKSIYQNEDKSNIETESIISEKQEVLKFYEWLYANCRPFRCTCFLITLLWCVGLFLGFLGQLILILLHLPTDKIVLYGRIILISLTICCIALTIVGTSKSRKEIRTLIATLKKEHLNIQ